MATKDIHFKWNRAERRKYLDSYVESDTPLCLNGSAHAQMTRNTKEVTCPICLERLKHKKDYKIVT